MTRELENIVESIIFASPEGASTKEITRCLRGAVATAREKDGQLALEAITRFAKVDETQVQAAIAHLNAVYEETGRAFLLVERPAGWRIMSRADFGPWVRELFPDKKPSRLTPSALETLAIIAYRQPVTKGSIEAVRGVSVDGPLQALLDRNVVRIAGRADLPGRPLLYETTDLFLDHFGIKTVDELPNAAELRSVKLPEPEAFTLPEPVPPQPELPLVTEEGAEAGAPAAGARLKRKEKAKKEKQAIAPALEAEAEREPKTETIPGAEGNPVPETARKETAAQEVETQTQTEAEAKAAIDDEQKPAPPVPRKGPAAVKKRAAVMEPTERPEPSTETKSGPATMAAVIPDTEWSPAEDEPEPEEDSEEAGEDEIPS